MSDLNTELTAIRTKLDRVRQRLEFERQRSAQIDARLAAIEAEKALLVKAVILLDKTIEEVSANGIGRIESTVTNGLRLVFDDPTLALKVVKNEGKRGNSYEIVGVRGDVEGPFLETFGGGIVNVASFLLRVLMSKRFKMGKAFFLDESFNNVSAQRLPKLSKLLRSLAHDGGYMIFVVTHQPILALAADRIYKAEPGPVGAPPTLQEITNGELAAEIAAMNYLDEERTMHPGPQRVVEAIVQDGRMVGIRDEFVLAGDEELPA